MKKINYFILLLFCLLTLTSCNKLKSYSASSGKDFIDEIYSYIDSEKDYLLIDVRSIDEYASGHFFGFTNYDIDKGSVDEFVYKISSMHSKKKAIFIVDKDGSNVESLGNALKDAGYKKVYIYLDGYTELSKNNENDFSIVTGTSDCEC